MKTFNFYATLLDSFQNYLDSELTYSKFWGNSEDPTKTEDEYERECYLQLIDKINRVPMTWENSEKADRGTAFNEIVDCIIQNRKSDKMDISSDAERQTITANFNNRSFEFPISVCREFSNYFSGAVPNVYCEAILPTKYGDVRLYGYIDELMPTSIHDIKTTGKYTAGKFRNNWQHVIYPYCLHESGSPEMIFEYNVLLIKETRLGVSYETFTETYNYRHDRDRARLIEICEKFIEFFEEPNNRLLITDKKIFGL